MPTPTAAGFAGRVARDLPPIPASKPKPVAPGPLRDVLPIARNAAWWRGFLNGVALERPVTAAWRDEAAELEKAA